MKDGTLDKEYFSTSQNEWHVKAFQKAEFREDWTEDDILIAKHGKSCSTRSQLAFYDKVNMKPNHKNLPEVHFSRETLQSYFAAWAVQKTSIWKEPINHHILQYHQVKGTY